MISSKGAISVPCSSLLAILPCSSPYDHGDDCGNDIDDCGSGDDDDGGGGGCDGGGDGDGYDADDSLRRLTTLVVRIESAA